MFHSYRVLEAGKATVYAALSAPKDITHVLTNNPALDQEREKHLIGVPYCPVGYLEIYLLEASTLNIMRIIIEIHYFKCNC